MTTSSDVVPSGWEQRAFKVPSTIESYYAKRGDAGWCYGVRFDESHANYFGVVHGGALMTFVDQALSMVIWEETDRGKCFTVQLTSNFLTALKPPAFVELKYDLMKKSRRLVIARGELYAGEDRIFEANGVWAIAAA